MAEPKKILVIDDDPDIQQVHRTVLESVGYVVLLASSGAEGQTLADAAHPDLVVLDIMMEEADSGFQAAQWLASKHPNVPVLMLSSIADASESLFDTTILRVAEMVNKPVGPQELLERVERLLARAAKLK